MLISVVYSDGQILFCNADCVSANLLNYVRRQTGNYDCEVVDLADESGLVLELDDYKMQSASKRLAHKGDKFILVEKKQKDQNDEDYDPVVPYYYSPLLEDCASLYPDIQTFYSVSMEEKKRARDERERPTSAKSSKRGGGDKAPADGKGLQKPGELRPTSSGVKKSSSTSVGSGRGKKK